MEEGTSPDSQAPHGYRPEFVSALDLLARACAILRRRGAALPVLVGGAVVEIETRSAIMTGDFDLQGGAVDVMAAALEEVGFVREARRGHKLGGFYHPDLLIGVEFVSGAYFDGLGDRQRVRLLDLPSGQIPVAAVEDMIADRLGQWVASHRRDGNLLRQACLMAELADELDEAYLERRIREETAGTIGAGILRGDGG